MLSLLHVGNPLFFLSRSTLSPVPTSLLVFCAPSPSESHGGRLQGCQSPTRDVSLGRRRSAGKHKQRLRLPFAAWRRTSACAPRAACSPPAANVPPLCMPDSNGSLAGL